MIGKAGILIEYGLQLSGDGHDYVGTGLKSGEKNYDVQPEK
ncbi:hypothetical protein [Niastella populi]|nr:hypothetical protein [Niastella populi]